MKVAFKKTLILIIAILLSSELFFAGCTTSKKEIPTEIILATTTSTMDTGLLDELLPRFEKEENIKVKPIAVGSGEAIAMGKRGDADVLLVHSPMDEEKFMKDGYGAVRKDVMYNDFVLIGPKSDPAGIKGSSVTEAMKKIAQKKAIFVSRADDSGTHKKEKKLWEKAGINPSGNWYIQTGQGMGETLRIADQKEGYVLTDRGTYLATKKSLSLVILVEKDKDLLNPYGVIAVSKKKFAKVKYTEALRFVNWMTSYKTQKFISTFGKDKYGQALFVPDSEEWKKKQ
jgi:tungstate transport system substrate-binding protein